MKLIYLMYIFPPKQLISIVQISLTQLLKSSASHSHQNAFTSSRRFAGILRLFHFRDHQIESLGDVFAVSSTGLSERALKFVGQFSSFFGLYLALLTFKIAFVSDDAQGDPIDTLSASILSAYIDLFAINGRIGIGLGTR